MTWTDERPTEPGEYWLSMPPGDRYHSQPRCRSAYVYESRRCMVTLEFDSPDAYEPVLVVGGCDETSSVWPDSSDEQLAAALGVTPCWLAFGAVCPRSAVGCGLNAVEQRYAK